VSEGEAAHLEWVLAQPGRPIFGVRAARILILSKAEDMPIYP
jgi:hypothetical protein